MDVADLVDLVAVDQVDVAHVVGIVKVVRADAEVIVQDAVFRAPVIVEVAVDVMGVIPDVVDARGLVKVVLGVQDVADLVQAHAHRMEKVHLVLHAIVALAVLVHAHHVHHVLDVVDVVGVIPDVVDAVDVQAAVKGTVLPNVADAPVDAISAVAVVPVAVTVVPVAVSVVPDVVLDVTAHVLEIATDVVMAVVDNVKTHVLLPAQQRVLEHAKLKHLVL